MKKLLAILSVVLFANQASANSCPDMYMELGFEPIQEGKIDMRNCGPEEPTDIGSYSFYCENFQPTFYFGHAVLFEKQDMMGVSHTLFSLCLIDNDEGLDVKVINKP